MTSYDAGKFTAQLSALKFFPTQKQAVVVVGEILLELCARDEDAERLVSLLLKRFNEWPGPARMRELAVELSSRGEVRPEGCDLCKDLEGLRRVFRIDELIPGSAPRKEIIDPGCSLVDSMPIERELQVKYKGSATHRFYAVTKFCSCALGVLRKSEFASSRS